MERIKNMGLKKSLFFLSVSCVCISLLLVLLVFCICKTIGEKYPGGGIAYSPEGGITFLEQPTREQQKILSALSFMELFSCVVFPLAGLAGAGALFYHIKLKKPIDLLRDGTAHIRAHDLDFSLPAVSSDELGEICAAFEEMRAELLKTNKELWRQAEERKRLNAAFSHDLRNPVTVIKGTVKLMKQGMADEQALNRLESYTLRIEQYVEAMSSIQRLEQMPVRADACTYALLRSELEDTAKLFAPGLSLSISAPGQGPVKLDHGIFLTVAENLIGNAARFSQSKLQIRLVEKKGFLVLSVTDDGPGYPDELVQNGPKPFDKRREDAGHFGMGLYSSEILCRKHGGMLKLTNADGQGAAAAAYFQVEMVDHL